MGLLELGRVLLNEEDTYQMSVHFICMSRFFNLLSVTISVHSVMPSVRHLFTWRADTDSYKPLSHLG